MSKNSIHQSLIHKVNNSIQSRNNHSNSNILILFDSIKLGSHLGCIHTSLQQQLWLQQQLQQQQRQQRLKFIGKYTKIKLKLYSLIRGQTVQTQLTSPLGNLLETVGTGSTSSSRGINGTISLGQGHTTSSLKYISGNTSLTNITWILTSSTIGLTSIT